MRIRLFVNQIEVPPCDCGLPENRHMTPVHWCGQDVLHILGRPLLYGDAFTITVDGHTEPQGEHHAGS